MRRRRSMAVAAVVLTACGAGRGADAVVADAVVADAVVADAVVADAGPPTFTATAASWPEADALFHRGDPRWLGADAAYSIDLHDGRILWLFGDSFIATSAAHVRTAARLVRNTVAIQAGADPVTAGFAPAWRTVAGSPASFFPEDGPRWHWPLHGVRLPDGRLVLCWSILRPTPGMGFGFAPDGWRITIVDDPSGPPAGWVLRTIDPPVLGPGTVIGTAVAVDGPDVLLLATSDGGAHTTFLARISIAALAAGDLTAFTWWDGVGWGDVAARAALFDGAPEASLHHELGLGLWLEVASRGFGATTIAIRAAVRPQGPWAAPVDVFTPPESLGARPFVYAGKAHPELAAGGALAVTYATNSFTFADLLTPPGSEQLYWPRFARITLTAAP